MRSWKIIWSYAAAQQQSTSHFVAVSAQLKNLSPPLHENVEMCTPSRAASGNKPASIGPSHREFRCFVIVRFDNMFVFFSALGWSFGTFSRRFWFKCQRLGWLIGLVPRGSWDKLASYVNDLFPCGPFLAFREVLRIYLGLSWRYPRICPSHMIGRGL